MGKSIYGLKISLPGSSLGFFSFDCSVLGLSGILGFGSIFSLYRGLDFITFAFILGHLSSLALITSLAGSFGGLKGGKNGLNSQDSGARVEGDGRVIGASRMSGWKYTFPSCLHFEVAGTPARFKASFFYLEIVRCLPRGLSNFLGCPSSCSGLLQLGFEV